MYVVLSHPNSSSSGRTAVLYLTADTTLSHRCSISWFVIKEFVDRVPVKWLSRPCLSTFSLLAKVAGLMNLQLCSSLPFNLRLLLSKQHGRIYRLPTPCSVACMYYCTVVWNASLHNKQASNPSSSDFGFTTSFIQDLCSPFRSMHSRLLNPVSA